jgi:hypothetical protein
MNIRLPILAGLAGLLCLPAAAQTIPAANPAPPGVFSIQEFGAKADGVTDCTEAIQKAVDAASVKGGVVQVPIGRWLCRGHLVLKMGVHLAGMNQAPQSWEPATGSILLVE